MTPSRRTVLRGLAGALPLLGAAPARGALLEALFAPAARLWERWARHDPESRETVDHAAWDALLARWRRPWPDGSTRVAYAAVTPDERAALGAYLARLAAVPVSRLARPEQRGFWINLYNATTIKVVLDAWPVRSIRDVTLSRGLFAAGPWDAPLATIEGEPVTLNDIEHRILRPIWRDPRLHYLLNCASIGCPDLAERAVTGANGEALLEAGAQRYVNHPRGVAVEPRLDGLLVSKLYGWFAEDFGGERGVVPHLLRYASPALAARIQAAPRIADYRYDWSLNDAA